MKKTYFPAVIGAVLLISGSLIAGLASADMDGDNHGKGKYGGYHNAGKVAAKRLDINNDGKISLDELTARQDRRFTKLDHDDNGMIEKHEFNARLIAMFQFMDRDGDRVLRGDELPGHRNGGKTHQHGDKAADHYKNS